MLATKELETYRARRTAGDSPSLALYRARLENEAAAVLSWNYDAAGEFYDVDAAALARITGARPLPNVTMADGSPITRAIVLPPGARARVRLIPDDHGWTRLEGEEGECYSDADRDALRADLWEFYGLEVTVTARDGSEASAAVWGYEIGTYWPGTERAQVWQYAEDIIGEALGELIDTTPDLSSALADTLPGLEGVA